ncbi:MULTISPECIES: hypothetical protein [unclassified Breznakia]|uniref:hypothetical protein n=1 Tax=unclassified Breznakia TaxID=2623764 RepID=UPI002476DD84|nr:MULTISPECIES: hypothetical protein [unclassified Breznakia]MDH6367388.1 CHASE2 domain-containing sensor protein [Breznakia sp. PH1-1]MDH6403920.1 CHASE2 domain-containing sensor protein [Breznakia sp. PF1-11]MDH6411629.1 CHASE2 domain-containing sensor protein [Breznakia sp. PFB1-11]MDH6414555.1 CHASE2 domain-containing sensor protein [Breznakia sp. PFB1-14]MDH6418661.1 CHASE2 domain-containing sensor protein [Breznakia sp. PFB1-12]
MEILINLVQVVAAIFATVAGGLYAGTYLYKERESSKGVSIVAGIIAGAILGSAIYFLIGMKV